MDLRTRSRLAVGNTAELDQEQHGPTDPSMRLRGKGAEGDRGQQENSSALKNLRPKPGGGQAGIQLLGKAVHHSQRAEHARCIEHQGHQREFGESFLALLPTRRSEVPLQGCSRQGHDKDLQAEAHLKLNSPARVPPLRLDRDHHHPVQEGAHRPYEKKTPTVSHQGRGRLRKASPRDEHQKLEDPLAASKDVLCVVSFPDVRDDRAGHANASPKVEVAERLCRTWSFTVRLALLRRGDLVPRLQGKT
mmetsp:Transcript_38926/g.93064  ORF Transcript_38926/g.93064 Transcript_38926/m.93064 type:complete len:248 (-) Transcript_38926:170-913(-)